MTPKRAKRRSEADFWAQISMRFPREFRRPIKFALLRSAPIFVAEKDRPREDDLFDRSSLGRGLFAFFLSLVNKVDLPPLAILKNVQMFVSQITWWVSHMFCMEEGQGGLPSYKIHGRNRRCRRPQRHRCGPASAPLAA